MRLNLARVLKLQSRAFRIAYWQARKDGFAPIAAYQWAIFEITGKVNNNLP